MSKEHLLELIKIISTALGDDIGLKIKAGKWWSYDFEKNEITFPEEFLLNYSPEQVIGFSIHEAGHRQITRIDLRKEEFKLFYSKNSFKLLLSVFEDARANNWMISLFPGANYYLGIIYDELVPEDLTTSQYLKSLQREIKVPDLHPYILYPYLEYILGVIYYWRFKKLPNIINQKTKQALKKTFSYFDEIFNCLPKKDAGEKERFVSGYKAVQLIKQYILEEYKKLIKESIENVSKALKENQIESGGNVSQKDLYSQAIGFIEEKAKELAEKLSPKIQRPDEGNIERQVGIPSTSLPQSFSELTFKDFIKETKRLEKCRQSICPYEQFYNQIGNIIQHLTGVLENYFLKNRRLRYQGYFKSGQRPDLRKVMNQSRKIQEKIPLEKDDLAVFLRRKLPTEREHRIALVLDESGSMSEPKRSAALAGLLLFIESLEQLNIDYAVIGFSETVIVHKEFGKGLSRAERENLFEEVSMYIPSGLTADADALALAIKLILEAPEDIIKLIIMISDGEGNINRTGKSFVELQEEAFKKDITVVGIGLGERASSVLKRYQLPILVKEIEELPKTLAKVLEERIVFECQ
ncbi:MAG TPA: VWA domain-containing protein [Candidatus Desulfofervidus auxilii]|uniref:VWA domain-containing protein n=1 Tax=Desulfofervidus auxilii TaxID=1621989 RepID=A0A7C0U4H4_DESA2|nr:VWA domain-containing protein [Candidatus Desulfofervidus auxilii]